MNIGRDLLPFAALLALNVPASAQTPPAVLIAAKTIQFTATKVIGGVPEEISVASLAQPNKAFIRDTDPKTKALDTIYASDGIMQTEYRPTRGHYTKSAAPATFGDVDTHAIALSWILGLLDAAQLTRFTHDASDSPGIYRTAFQEQGGKDSQEKLTLDVATGLPKELMFVERPHGTANAALVPVEGVRFSEWKLNAPIDARSFAFKPPPSVPLYVRPNLLADGIQAPDFTADDKNGRPVKLSDYKGKVVVLDFWATWCGPCQASLPHTTAIAKQYAAKGVTVLAVNVWDKPNAFQAWLPTHPQYAALHFAIDPATVQDKGIATGLYGVSGIPTQYVIGRNGRIVKSIVGYDAGSTSLEDALKAAGAG